MHRLTSLFSRRTTSDPEESFDMASSSSTRIIVGLGNPGSKYANTRHNAGFFVIDELARRLGAPESRKRFRGEISEVRFGDYKLVLVQPQTFMNESGVTVREAFHWYKPALDQMLIVVDDLDLPFGDLRLRAKGSAGGHNGLKSIIQHLGTQDFPRLRVGIGRGRSATVAHVLSRFAPEEEANLPKVISRAADVAELWVRNGALETMNVANDPANQPLAPQIATSSTVKEGQ
jgi:peptidyl-tRNA hydrolase, PTH1 family